MSCALNLLTELCGLDFMDDIDINPSSMGSIFGCGYHRTLGSRNGQSTIGPKLFGSSAVVWYIICFDFLNWALWLRIYGAYWYQSFIHRSNIWRVERTDPWVPESDHPPFGRIYLVVVPSYDMSCVLIIFNGLYGWDSMAVNDINPSSMAPIFGVWIGTTLRVAKWTIRYWATAIW